MRLGRLGRRRGAANTLLGGTLAETVVLGVVLLGAGRASLAGLGALAALAVLVVLVPASWAGAVSITVTVTVALAVIGVLLLFAAAVGVGRAQHLLAVQVE